MSAVRMVAYGVLEMEHNDAPASTPWQAPRTDAELAEEKEKKRKRDELRKLVSDELKKYDMLISRQVVPKGKAWRTKANAHVLFGPRAGKKGFVVREELVTGSFRECCVKAAGLLDQIEELNGEARTPLPWSISGNPQR